MCGHYILYRRARAALIKCVLAAPGMSIDQGDQGLRLSPVFLVGLRNDISSMGFFLFSIAMAQR